MRKTKTLLAFCLITALLISPLAGMDDHGANVVITKKDGTLTRGELIAVKWNALVISADESSPMEYTSVAIEEIGNVTVIKESKVIKGMLWGFLIGGGIGAALGLIAGNDRPGLVSLSAESKAEILGFFFGVIGLGLGAEIEGGGEEIFRFENLSKEDRDSALLKLSKYAAIKDVR